MAIRVTDLTEDTTPGANDVIPIVDVGSGVTKKVKASVLVNAFMPTGMIIIWGVNSPPSGWLLCDGSSVDRTTYAALFAIIGTNFGNVDGSHFNLPNLKGKVPVGKDSGQTEFDTLAKTGGEKTHTLTTAELANHQHTGQTDVQGNHSHNWSEGGGLSYVRNRAPGQGGIAYPGGGSNWDYGFPSGGTTSNGAHNHNFTTNGEGGGTAHNNLPPFTTLNFIIKT